MGIVTVALGVAIIAGSFIGLKPTPAADQLELTNTHCVGALSLAPACDKKKTVTLFCDQGLPYAGTVEEGVALFARRNV